MTSFLCQCGVASPSVDYLLARTGDTVQHTEHGPRASPVHAPRQVLPLALGVELGEELGFLDQAASGRRGLFSKVGLPLLSCI